MEFVKTFVKSVRAVLIARLREFYRDKAAFYWHLFLPCFIIASFYFIFGSSQNPSYKVGVIEAENTYTTVAKAGRIGIQSSDMRFETEQTSSALSQSRTRLNLYPPGFSKYDASSVVPAVFVKAKQAGIQSSDMRFETEQTSSALSQSRTRLNLYPPGFSKYDASSVVPAVFAKAKQAGIQSSDMRFETEQTSSALSQSRTRLNLYPPGFSKYDASSVVPAVFVKAKRAGIQSSDIRFETEQTYIQSSGQLEEFFQLKYIQFILQEKEEGLNKIRNHNLDMLVEPGTPLKYWVNDSNRKAYFLEKILKGSYSKPIKKMPSLDRDVSYVDWVFPGILALNIMFSCLWGVGWLMVKYRDDGYLKRLHATPLKVYHFMIGQMLARLLIIFCGTGIVFIVGSWAIDFEMQGSYLDLSVCYLLGVLSLISVGLFVAVRTTSKEFADGVLNLFSWPMIIFSGMWFSLEGASSWILAFAYSLPLTHLVESTRKIMLEGAVLSELWLNVSAMAVFSIVMFTVVSVLFKWNDK